MPNTYTLLETITVGAAGAASVTFNSIPQTGYTDLVIKVSARDTRASAYYDLGISFNGLTTNLTGRILYGDGSGTASYNVSNGNVAFDNSDTSTANTFSNLEYYIPNYASANYKSFSVDNVTENNATASALALLSAGLWSSTAAITSVTFTPLSGTLKQHSTFSLYGVSALGTTPTKAPKATGGSIIQTDGTYWYHAFLSSGTFTPATALSCDVLVVAGGGGGGNGGGGAGGYRTTTGLSVGTSANTVTIGAGGAGCTSANNSTVGGDSVFSSITSTGGGAGKISISPVAGGSGAGGTAWGSSGSSGTVTGAAGNTPSTSPSQGNNGGDGASAGSTYRGGGGGGGAGAVGGTGAIAKGGDGGAGLNTLSSWLSTTGLGVSGYVAGGGGGGSNGVPYSAGGAGGGGGGGDTGNATAGTANTGGGGGGVYGNYPASAGGSGLVIIRYLAA